MSTILQINRKTRKMAIEMQHAILFQSGADNYEYRKLIEEMKNFIVRNKDPILKPSHRLGMYYPKEEPVWAVLQYHEQIE